MLFSLKNKSYIWTQNGFFTNRRIYRSFETLLWFKLNAYMLIWERNVSQNHYWISTFQLKCFLPEADRLLVVFKNLNICWFSLSLMWGLSLTTVFLQIFWFNKKNVTLPLLKATSLELHTYRRGLVPLLKHFWVLTFDITYADVFSSHLNIDQIRRTWKTWSSACLCSLVVAVLKGALWYFYDRVWCVSDNFLP